MDILFQTTKLQKLCTDAKDAQRRYGERCAKLLRRRLDDIRAVDSLAILRTIPGPRCHELAGDRKGQLSVDLEHPLRLIFIPAHEPRPCKPDGGLDWTMVTKVMIVEIVDTHE